jgi:TATA-binding protein-associated factor
MTDNSQKTDAALNAGDAIGQDVIDALQVVQSVTPVVHESLYPKVRAILFSRCCVPVILPAHITFRYHPAKVTELLPHIVRATKCGFSVVRSMAARTFSTIANVITSSSLQILIEEVIPFLGDTQNVIHRQGAAELIYRILFRTFFQWIICAYHSLQHLSASYP